MFALAGDDYNGSPITVDVPAGVTMQPLMISISDDNIVECIERFTVMMASVTTCGVTIGDTNNSSAVVITDDDSKLPRHELQRYHFHEVYVCWFICVYFNAF